MKHPACPDLCSWHWLALQLLTEIHLPRVWAGTQSWGPAKAVSCAWCVGWLSFVPAAAFPRSQTPQDCLTTEPEQNPCSSLLTLAREKNKLFAQVGFKEKWKSLVLQKKEIWPTNHSWHQNKNWELCNFLCSVKYWCFLLLSRLSIDVPDIWFRWRECKSPAPKENGGKVIKWTSDTFTMLKTDWDFASRTDIATCPGQSSQGHGLKFTAWNAAAQHLSEAGLLQPSVRWGFFREGWESPPSCTQGWMFSVT